MVLFQRFSKPIAKKNHPIMRFVFCRFFFVCFGLKHNSFIEAAA